MFRTRTGFKITALSSKLNKLFINISLWAVSTSYPQNYTSKLVKKQMQWIIITILLEFKQNKNGNILKNY